jgi:hypothetical protein
VILVLFFQYRADYEVEVSPLSKTEYENCIESIESYDVTIDMLSEYVENLDSVQREFLETRLPENFKILLEPQTLDPDKFEGLKGSLKTYCKVEDFQDLMEKHYSLKQLAYVGQDWVKSKTEAPVSSISVSGDKKNLNSLFPAPINIFSLSNTFLSTKILIC